VETKGTEKIENRNTEIPTYLLEQHQQGDKHTHTHSYTDRRAGIQAEIQLDKLGQLLTYIYTH